MPRLPGLAPLLSAAFALLLAASEIRAESEEESREEAATYTIEVREKRPVSAASAFVRDSRSFELRVLEDPGEILEVTPGLATAQHAGGGKANQYLVRGFDADHGTDLAVSVDDVPVNMRSHAHGQGYTDLHFVIPETVERVEITKGTYDAEVGDFATAGSVNLVTRERAEESFVRVEGGLFDTQRYLTLLSPRSGPFGGEDPEASALVAFEAFGTDGPFENEDDHWRYNAFGRLGWDLGERTRLEGTAHVYTADWHASGQIPQRAVDRPGFDRWDAVDPTEGGDSSTARLLLRLLHEPSDRERIAVDVWGIWYSLDLYSNFTFFLDDPVLGDQIVQQDDRLVYGASASYRRVLEGLPVPVSVSTGLDTRSDDAYVRLRRAFRRERREVLAEDRILERSFAAWLETEIVPLPWVRTVLGLRGEHFSYQVSNRSGIPGRAEGHTSDSILLPKASVILSPFGPGAPLASEVGALRELELFLNYGKGFHSNDARDAVAHPREPTLPSAQGWEVGLRTSLFERLDVAVAYWWLNLQRELVFVGDAGTTEVSSRSRREGVELSAELEILDWLFWQGDLAYSSGELAGGAKIPQAVRFVAGSSLVARHPSGVSAELRYETLGERYGTEGTSTRLRSYAVWNAALRYRRGPFEVSLAFENLFDTEWESAEFFYASRLRGERAAGFEDHHFVPGTPRTVRLGLSVFF